MRIYKYVYIVVFFMLVCMRAHSSGSHFKYRSPRRNTRNYAKEASCDTLPKCYGVKPYVCARCLTDVRTRCVCVFLLLGCDALAKSVHLKITASQEHASRASKPRLTPYSKRAANASVSSTRSLNSSVVLPPFRTGYVDAMLYYTSIYISSVYRHRAAIRAILVSI